MTLKERILRHYKTQRACQRVLRVKTYQQFWEALQPDSPQKTLQNRIIKHLEKLEASK